MCVLYSRRVPRSGKLGSAPCLHRFDNFFGIDSLLYECLDRITNFFYAYSVLTKSEYAFIPILVLAKL